MKAQYITMLLVLCITKSLHACRIEVVNNTKINMLIKDQEVGVIFRLDAGDSCLVGEQHRRPTVLVYMQVDRYEGAPYKREFTVKQIACGKGKPLMLSMSNVIDNTLDTGVFKRTDVANSHKKLKATGQG